MDTSYPKDLDAILASLETLHPTDQNDVKDILAQRAAVLLEGINPDEDLFTKILSTRRTDLLKLLKGHPVPSFFKSKRWVKNSIKDADEAFHTLLYEDFRDTLISTKDLACIAADRGWVTLFENTAPDAILDDAHTVSLFITQCHPNIAPHLAHLLRVHVDFIQNAHFSEDIVTLFPDDLKMIAAFMKLGLTIQESSLTFKEPHPIDPFLEKSKTAHGKMMLIAGESSLENILARPADAAFYGHTNARIDNRQHWL